MAEVVYSLAVLTSLLCAALLLRQYFLTGQKLLLWSTLCFAGLTLTNVMVIVDLMIIPEIDLHRVRWLMTAASLSVLLYGLIWESK